MSHHVMSLSHIVVQVCAYTHTAQYRRVCRPDCRIIDKQDHIYDTATSVCVCSERSCVRDPV